MREPTAHVPQPAVGKVLDPRGEPIVELQRVSRCYPATEALRDIDLQIRHGQVYAVIGPNGSGKSTLIRTINLLERPSSGRVILGGTDAWAVSAADRVALMRQMTLVAQKPVLFNMTVADNIGYGLRLRRCADEELRTITQQVAELLEVDHLLKRNALRLSGGEAQRVAMARALAIRPQLLLLDEPSANLDPNQTLVLERAIRSIHSEQRCTVLLITHHLAQARRVSDEVMLLWQGRLVEQQATDAFFRSPQHPESQGFLERERV